MAGDTLSQLLRELYAGVGDERRVAQFTRLAAPALGSHTGAISVRENVLRPGATLVMAGAKASDEARRRYDATYVASDDNHWFHRARPHFRPGGVFLGDLLATTKEMKKTRYYAEFLRDIDTMHSLAMCLDVDPQRSVVLSFCRSEQQGAYDADHVEFANVLAPHVSHAFALIEERRRLVRVSHMRFACFNLDARLGVLSMDAQAEEVLGAGWLRLTSGRIDPPDPRTQRLWKSHCKAREGEPCRQLAPVPVYGRDGALVALMSLVQTGLFNDEDPVKYVCRVRVLRPRVAADLAPLLVAMFQLSPAEARLATVLHATGDLAEAAQQCGISFSTARTRLAALFGKMQVRRQSALLDLLDALLDCCPPSE